MLLCEVNDASEGMSPVDNVENADYLRLQPSQSFASILGTPRHAFALGERS